MSIQSPLPKESLAPLLLWKVFLYSNLFYFALPFFLKSQGIQAEPWFLAPDFSDPLQLAMMGMALFGVAASFVIPPIIGKSVGKNLSESATSADVWKLGFVPWIIQMALREVPGVAGVALVLQTKMAGHGVVFFTVSFLLLFASRPTERSFKTLLGTSLGERERL